MFVGHATLAFAAVAFAAIAVGYRRDRALALAVAGAAFATVPDVDMVYALFGVLGADATSPFALTQSFWAASTAVHRSITHSVVLALPAALAFALVGRRADTTMRPGEWARSAGAPRAADDLPAISWITRRRVLGAAVVLGLIAVSGLQSGALGAAIMVVFSVAGLAVGAVAARYGLAFRERLAVALVGLASHPFGDVFTGGPPQFFYPFSVAAFDGRLAVSPDPTMNLLWAFAFELAAIWLGVAAYARLRGVRLDEHVNPRATLGAAYALAAFVIPPPTLSTSYQFVFSVLAVGFVGVVPRSRRLPDPVTAATTALAAVTVAGSAYAIAYVLGIPAPVVLSEHSIPLLS